MTRIVVVIVAYLIGSIPFGYLIVRGKIGADIRQTGSGGTGATNVSRRAGKVAGVLTLVLDAAKGSAAVFIAKTFTGSDWIIAAAAVAVLVGHIFPVWLGFRGGKGVATGAGVFLVLAPVALLLAGILFLAIVFFTRYVSLGSMIGATTIPLFVWLQSDSRPLLIAAVLGALLIVFAHRGNIGRLAHGTEAQI
ncbi:MAG TPA: glycerol-3-phosphate 1-O-acyltransferase PlsY [Pyrinomonadaceae bacterium]|jgi:acyl phosphate:glycerol-3-phosphate acyltransferase|nr:glycerol-3-phosphate 1-O-acyltransferase PlsY [Pyrinomonadaceae bacterium]